MELFDLSDKTERVILVGVQENDGDDTEESLQELAELAKTAGAEVVGTVIQKRERIHPGTYVGKGKIDEIRTLLNALDATGIICDDELSPVQMNHLQQELESKIMDRTLLILDIFASRAVTKEGKIQVELAQLRYRAVRLVGLGSSLSRLGGGIGTRGPGEKKLEMDRRLIKERISQLKKELEHVKKHRELLREGRKKDRVMTAAIVGYTNAGKSTLFNFITQANVYAADQLFATLDPTLRRLQIQDVGTAILADTVGFVRQLPHDLVSAFKSTLQETVEASLLLHVIDAADARKIENIEAVNLVLEEIKADKVPALLVYNKIDLLENVAPHIEYDDENKPVAVYLSAHSGEGLDLLLEAIKVRLKNEILSFTLTLLPQEGKIRHALYQLDSIRHEQISDEGEFILNVQIDKVEWLKLCKQFPKLSEIIY